MKVKELIKELQKFPGDMMVMGSWEGQFCDVREVGAYFWSDEYRWVYDGHQGINEYIVFLDVD